MATEPVESFETRYAKITFKYLRASSSGSRGTFHGHCYDVGITIPGSEKQTIILEIPFQNPDVLMARLQKEFDGMEDETIGIATIRAKLRNARSTSFAISKT